MVPGELGGGQAGNSLTYQNTKVRGDRCVSHNRCALPRQVFPVQCVWSTDCHLPLRPLIGHSSVLAFARIGWFFGSEPGAEAALGGVYLPAVDRLVGDVCGALGELRQLQVERGSAMVSCYPGRPWPIRAENPLLRPVDC